MINIVLSTLLIVLGQVVQSTISANPGLNFNLLGPVVQKRVSLTLGKLKYSNQTF